MTLGTSDADGLPWASPVYFAFASFSELVWVSRPEARHSRNIEVRPEVGIAIFDSRQPPGTGKGFYMAARAEELTGHPDFDRALEAFSRRGVEQGGKAFTRDDVQPPARLRLYRALASEQFVLGEGDQRIAVSLDA
jgi:Pyridoxamine 5'-phosphate oxidase